MSASRSVAPSVLLSGTPSSSRTSSSSHAVVGHADTGSSSSSSGAEELIFEESCRVLAVTCNELHQLLYQRKKTAGASDGARATSNTATLQYSQMSHEQAQSLTSHLLLQANILVQQVTQHWTGKHRGKRRRSEEEHVCHDPASLPWPKEDLCECRTRRPRDDAHEKAQSAMHQVDAPIPAPTSVDSMEAIDAPIRRAVLPFSNIKLLEQNIIQLRTSRGQQLRQQKQHSDSPTENGIDISPKDILLLQQHFAQLLNYKLPTKPTSTAVPTQSPAQPALLLAVSTPLALVHPFGLMIHEFATQFDHQAQFIRGGATGSFIIDRAFLQTQTGAISTFLQSHETLIVLAYPYLYQTSLCRKVLRSTLRACILNHAVIAPIMWQWYLEAYAAEQVEMDQQVLLMRDVELSEMGLVFPFNLDSRSLLAGHDASQAPVPHANEYADHDHDIDASPHSQGRPRTVSDEPVDHLIHSDEEGESRHRHRQRSHEEEQQQQQRQREHRDAIHQQQNPRTPPRRNSSAGGSYNGAGSLAFLSATPARIKSSLTGMSSMLATTVEAFHTPTTGAQQFQSARRNSFPTSPLAHSNSGSNHLPSFGAAATASSDAPPAPLPYARSTSLLSTLDAAQTVDEKLRVLIQVCRTITQELDEFLFKHGLDTTMQSGNAVSANGSDSIVHDPTTPLAVPRSKLYSLTCDDLFQIFAFCLVRAQPQVRTSISSLALLSDFIEGSQLSGEGGYCLTTMQCAVSLVQAWSPEMIVPSHSHAQFQTPPNRYHRKPSVSGIDLSLLTPVPSFHNGSMSSAPATPSSFAAASASTLLVTPSKGSLRDPSATLSAFPSHNEYAGQLSANLDAFYVAADYLAADSQWTYLFEKEGVQVMRKMYAGNPISSIKGTSIIHRSPQTIQAFLRNINIRQLVDDLFIQGRVLAHLAADTKIVQYFFRARNWCARQKTDMVLLLHQGVCPDGVTLVTLAFSVPYESCPPSQPGFSRASVRASGWMLKPVNGGMSTHVTYIVSPDGNGFPSWVVNLLSTKQPMLIRNVRDHLYHTTKPDIISPVNPAAAAAVAPANVSTSAPPSPLLQSHRPSISFHGLSGLNGIVLPPGTPILSGLAAPSTPRLRHGLSAADDVALDRLVEQLRLDGYVE